MPDDIRLFFTSQDDIAQALKKYIDRYLSGSIEDSLFQLTILEVVKANRNLLYKPESNDFTIRSKNILGKKRITILQKITEVLI